MEEKDQQHSSHENEQVNERGAQWALKWHLISNVFSTVKVLIVCATIVACVWIASREFGATVQLFTKMSIDRWIMVAIIVILGNSQINLLRRSQKSIGREQSRTSQLELKYDPNRESSGLDKSGRSPEGGD